MDPDFVNKYNALLNRLKQIENFDGSDPRELPKFLNKVESLLPTLNSFEPYYRTQLFDYIKNKCTDRAHELVIVRSGGNKVESWHKLKELLLHSYAEREASYTLIHKIRTSVLDSNIEQYFQKISKLKARLLNRKQTHNDTLYSLEDIERITLQVFRDHLPEPTHSMILRRNPRSMEEAYRYILELQQQYYTQSGPMAGEEAATFSTSNRHAFGMQRSLSTSGKAIYGERIGSATGGGLNKSMSYNGSYKDKYDAKAVGKGGSGGSVSYYGGAGNSYKSGSYASASQKPSFKGGGPSSNSSAGTGSANKKDSTSKPLTSGKSGWKK